MKKYGQVIAKLRKEQGLTQEQLGRKLNVSYQAVSKWENSLSEPDLNTLEKIVDVFGISIADFFELANSEQAYKQKEEKKLLQKKEKWYKDILKKKPWYIVAGLSFLTVILSLCAFLIPLNLSAKQVFKRYDPSVFYMTTYRNNQAANYASGFLLIIKALRLRFIPILKTAQAQQYS